MLANVESGPVSLCTLDVQVVWRNSCGESYVVEASRGNHQYQTQEPSEPTTWTHQEQMKGGGRKTDRNTSRTTKRGSQKTDDRHLGNCGDIAAKRRGWEFRRRRGRPTR
eukprot:9211263-Pyramimonas_sp.AAC.1